MSIFAINLKVDYYHPYFISLFLKILFVYVKERDRAGGVGDEEAGSLLMRECDRRLGPRTLGS